VREAIAAAVSERPPVYSTRAPEAGD
jgi:hypothetical protein